MKKRKIKFNNNLIYLMIAVIVILMLILGRPTKEKVEVEESAETIEENVGSGILVVESAPSDAEVFVDNSFSGKSPLTLNNIAVGSYDIVIKREGYEDFVSQVIIEAGKKTSLEARLVLIPVETPVEEKTAIETVEEEKEETAITPKANNTINIGEGFLLYYDFSKREFISNRQTEQDVFSKRFDKYLVFTRFNPVNIKTIGKGIGEVEKEDCIGINGGLEYLRSGQSLCVVTKENQIVALGGTWENTKNAELSLKLFS